MHFSAKMQQYFHWLIWIAMQLFLLVMHVYDSTFCTLFYMEFSFLRPVHSKTSRPLSTENRQFLRERHLPRSCLARFSSYPPQSLHEQHLRFYLNQCLKLTIRILPQPNMRVEQGYYCIIICYFIITYTIC